MQARKHASETSNLALKPRADVTRGPKQWYQWLQKKDDVLQIFEKCISNRGKPSHNGQT